MSAKEFAVEIAKVLRDGGFEVFFVGGGLRDNLLGREPKDWDLATNATPDNVKDLFPNAVFAGASFGVSILRNNGHQVEIATFRKDLGASDGRRPDRVEFTTAKEDVKRRDFTINALLQDPFTGQVIDHVGGLQDLIQRKIRTVGDPDQRFAEDHLRILRAFRFSAQLGFEIEEKTLEAIHRNAHLVKDLAQERITAEISKILAHDVSKMVDVDNSGCIGHLFKMQNRMKDPLKSGLLYGNQKIANESIRFHVLCQLSDIENVDDFGNFLKRWKLPNKVVNDVLHMIALVFSSDAPRLDEFTVDVVRLVEKNPDASKVFFDWCGHNEDFEKLYQLAMTPPILTGHDLVQFGFSGRMIGELLTDVRNQQILGKLKTREEALAYLNLSL